MIERGTDLRWSAGAGEHTESSFWSVLLPLLTAVAALKGVRLPNRWSATQAQIDYSFGFTKRGLFGASVTPLLHLRQYQNFAWFSLAALVALLLLLLRLAWSPSVRERVATPWLAAAFLSSYAITYLANLDGYLEIFLAVLTLPLLLIRRSALRCALALPVIVVTLLVHELSLLVFVPVLLWSFVLQGVTAEARPERRRIWWQAGLLFGIALATTLVVALRPSLAPPQFQAMEKAIQAEVNFPVRRDLFGILSLSAATNAARMSSTWRTGGWWREQIVGLLTLGPTITLLLLGTRRVLRTHRRPLPHWLFPGSVVLAFAPLLLHGLGVDVTRWNALATMTTFVILIVSCWYTSGPRLPYRPSFVHALVAVTLLNMATGDIMLDGVRVRTFPFFPEFRRVRPLLHPSRWQPADASALPLIPLLHTMKEDG